MRESKLIFSGLIFKNEQIKAKQVPLTLLPETAIENVGKINYEAYKVMIVHVLINILTY